MTIHLKSIDENVWNFTKMAAKLQNIKNLSNARKYVLQNTCPERMIAR